MATNSGEISTNELLDGAASENWKHLPAVGHVAPQVALLKSGEVDARTLDGVIDLFAFAPFTCRGSAPNVRGLYLSYDAGIDEGTARCFSGLVNLRIDSKRPVSLSWFDRAPLDGLSLADDSLTQWSEVGRIPLRNVRLLWSGKPLDQLPRSVKKLSIGAWPNLPLKALAPVWDLPNLEGVALHNITLSSLRPLSRAQHLRDLAVSTKSLRGVEALVNLHSLQLTSKSSCPPLSDLMSNKGLMSLEVRTRYPPPDLAEVGHLSKLERLALSFGYLDDVVEIASLGFLRSLGQIKDLSVLKVRLVDRDISPVYALPQLRVLKLAGDFGPGMKRLVASRKRQKGVVTEIHQLGTAKPRRSPGEPVRLRGAWTIFDDLAATLNRRSNYEVETAVKAALKKEAPEVLARIEFDSEADAFSARTASRKDINVVARVVRSLIAEQVRRARGIR